MPEMTYPKGSDKPVPAKPGKCDGCGERKPIVTVSSWGNYCGACSENLWDTWQKRGQDDWDKRAKIMHPPGDETPFRLEDDTQI